MQNSPIYDADGNLVEMFTPAQAAAFLSVSVHTLAVWRRSAVRKGPRYFKVRPRI